MKGPLNDLSPQLYLQRLLWVVLHLLLRARRFLVAHGKDILKELSVVFRQFGRRESRKGK